MAELVMFHHAQGLTKGLIAFAKQLEEAGHIVHTPDLYDGNTFESLEEGIGYAREIGFAEIAHRGDLAVEKLPNEIVYAGFSLGVGTAQKHAQTRAGAIGALFFYSCFPVSEFGSSWPENVPVQIHGKDGDEFFVNDGDIDSARELIKQAKNAELFLYPGEQHIFTDSSLSSFDLESTELLIKRVLGFLSNL